MNPISDDFYKPDILTQIAFCQSWALPIRTRVLSLYLKGRYSFTLDREFLRNTTLAVLKMLLCEAGEIDDVDGAIDEYIEQYFVIAANTGTEPVQGVPVCA